MCIPNKVLEFTMFSVYERLNRFIPYHLEDKMNLRIPGPTPCPDYVLKAMGQDMINHRGPEFQDMIHRTTERLKKVFETKNDVFILTGSGTGAMEAAIVNTLSPDDTVLSVSIGVFGDRLAEIAEVYGANVIRFTTEWGVAADPNELKKTLDDNPNIKAVLVTHNETSTGVTNDMETISKIVKDAGKLLLVDAISSLSSIPFYTDKWDCDVVMSGSQKGYMIPPGLAFVSVSQGAWDAFKEAKMPRFYWDFGRAKTYLERGQTPWTPAISMFYALDVALNGMFEEGMENIFQRHVDIANQTRKGVKDLGLELFAQESHASNTVTAINIPQNVNAGDLAKKMQSDHDVVLGGGQGNLSGKIFRIGHLGYVSENDISSVLKALHDVLPQIGFQAAK